MAKEKNLTTVTSVAAADFARLVTSAGASVKATAANLAKYIIETYNGSTVAGSAQSVKSALDSLNSKSSGTLTGEHLNDALEYQKAGIMCTVKIPALKNLTGETENALGTLPTGYRPYNSAVQTFIGVTSGSGFSRSLRITINTSGTITAYLYGSTSITGAVNTRGCITFPVA